MITGKKGVERHHIQANCVFSSGNLEGRRKEAREEPRHGCLALLQLCGNSVPQAHTLYSAINELCLDRRSILSVVGLPSTAYCSFFFSTLTIATICIWVLAPRISIRGARVSYQPKLRSASHIPLLHSRCCSCCSCCFCCFCFLISGFE